jgi:hypothetical protein
MSVMCGIHTWQSANAPRQCVSERKDIHVIGPKIKPGSINSVFSAVMNFVAPALLGHYRRTQ